MSPSRNRCSRTSKTSRARNGCCITNLAWDNIKDDIYETKREVFKLVSQEVPNKEIASLLGISEASVRVYKAEVFEKMRTEITRLNRELG